MCIIIIIIIIIAIRSKMHKRETYFQRFGSLIVLKPRSWICFMISEAD